MKKILFCLALCGAFVLGAAESGDYGPGFRDTRLGETMSVVTSKYRNHIQRRADNEKTGEMHLIARFDDQDVTFTFLSENPAVTSELLRFADDRLMPDFYNAKLVAVKVAFPEADFPVEPIRRKIAGSVSQPPAETRTLLRFRLCRDGYLFKGYYVDIEENRAVYKDAAGGHETVVVSFGKPAVFIVDKEIDGNTKSRVAISGFDPEKFLETFYTEEYSPCTLVDQEFDHYRLPKSKWGQGKPYPCLPYLVRRSETLIKQIGSARENAAAAAARKQAEAENAANAAKVDRALDF